MKEGDSEGMLRGKGEERKVRGRVKGEGKEGKYWGNSKRGIIRGNG